jgi:hypothetical protein
LAASARRALLQQAGAVVHPVQAVFGFHGGGAGIDGLPLRQRACGVAPRLEQVALVQEDRAETRPRCQRLALGNLGLAAAPQLGQATPRAGIFGRAIQVVQSSPACVDWPDCRRGLCSGGGRKAARARRRTNPSNPQE